MACIIPHVPSWELDSCYLCCCGFRRATNFKNEPCSAQEMITRLRKVYFFLGQSLGCGMFQEAAFFFEFPSSDHFASVLSGSPDYPDALSLFWACLSGLHLLICLGALPVLGKTSETMRESVVVLIRAPRTHKVLSNTFLAS